MPARKAPPWTSQEIAVLRAEYPAIGIDVADMLPERSWSAIYVMANKLGIRCIRPAPAPRCRIEGPALEEAILLRERDGWSFARIGAKFGTCESAASNAVTIALCTRHGFVPAQRDAYGRLTAEGRDRLRLALKKGLKGVDIQLRLGVSAACVAEQRRRYNAELKDRGKALLPPPGNGAAYSGVKVPRATKLAAEALFLQGFGTAKVSERTGVSKTVATRVRNRLIARLRRKGALLPGCDAAGVRRVTAESDGFITPEQVELVRAALLARMPVRRAGLTYAVGHCSAIRIRDQLAAELKAQGKALAAPVLPGRVKTQPLDPDWPPRGQAGIYAFRAILRDMPFDAAKELWREQRRVQRQAEREAAAAERQRPKTFADQLARVAAGATLIGAVRRAHLDPHFQPERQSAHA